MSSEISRSKLHWGRIVTAGLLSEISLIVASIPLGLLLGDAFLRYTAPPGSFLTCFLGALWASRRIESRFVLHGLLIGLVAAVFYIVISRFQTEPLAYVIAHALKLIGGATGAYVAEIRRTYAPGR
jgi:putative membrane protein (TIGR04086 family)